MAEENHRNMDAEVALLKCLFSGINESDTSGTSVQFVSPFTSPEQRLKVRTPQFADFITTVNKQYQSEGGHVLDVACGRGNDSALLIHNGLRAVSCDLSEEMVRLSQECKESFIKGGYKGFEEWKIFQADMMRIEEAISTTDGVPKQYDSIMCLISMMFICTDEELKKTFSSFANILRPGGALIIDTRNFAAMAKTGKSVQNGRNSYSVDEYNGLSNIVPYTICGPAPDRKPLAVFMDYRRTNGSSVYVVSRVFSREQITSVAKSTFGENCKITVLYDLKVESECKPEDACIITYIIEKPTI